MPGALERVRETEMRMSTMRCAAVAAAMPAEAAAATRVGGCRYHHCGCEDDGDARSNEPSPLRSYDFRQDTLPSKAANAIEEGADVAGRRIASPSNMPIRANKDKLSFVYVSDS